MNKPKQQSKKPLILEEFEKTARVASEQIGLIPTPQKENDTSAPTQEEEALKAKNEAQGQRNIEILNREIKDMQVNKQEEKRQKLQEELASKQAVLEKPVPMSIAKKGRRMLGGIMGKFRKQNQTQQNQTFVETRKPPSS